MLKKLQNLIPLLLIFKLGDGERSKRSLCVLDKEGCFDSLGCFPCTNGFMPYSPEQINMQFYLYSPLKEPYSAEQTFTYADFKDNTSHPNVVLDPQKNLWVIIHGFEGQWPLPWLELMRTKLLAKGNNVLVARWSDGTAYPGNFPQSSSNGLVVGALTAKAIQSLQAVHHFSLDRVNLIGFSLGVHIAGHIGRHLGGQAGQIVGLDPPEKLYQGKGLDGKLDPSDAQMVQAIHTHGAPLRQGGLGTMIPMGDIDIYVNGGKVQPGCPVSKRHDFNIKQFYNIIEAVGCNHLRAPALFTDSIDDKCDYKAFPCDSRETWKKGYCFNCQKGCVRLGYQLDTKTKLRGKFFLSTLVSEELRDGDFCGEQYRVILFPNQDVHGKIYIDLYNDNLHLPREAKFQKTDNWLKKEGGAKVVAAPFSKITKLRIRFDRYNILVSKGPETWKLLQAVVVKPDGQGFVYNDTIGATVTDDAFVDVDLNPEWVEQEALMARVVSSALSPSPSLLLFLMVFLASWARS